MKKSQRLKVLVFLGNFFIRYIFLLLGGLGALALMRNSAGMIIGSMLISLDLLLSVYWSFYLPAKFKKEGNDMFKDFSILFIMMLVEKNFDNEHFYLFKLKELMPDMTYKKLAEQTKMKAVRQKVVEVKNWLKHNVTKEMIKE